MSAIRCLSTAEAMQRKQFASWFINQCELNPNLQRRLLCQMKHTFLLMVQLTSKTVDFGLNIIHKLSGPHLFPLNELLFGALSQRRKLITGPYFSEDHSRNAERYLQMLNEYLFLKLVEKGMTPFISNKVTRGYIYKHI